MKKYLFIIIGIIFAIFVALFGYSAYQYYIALHSDDPIDPYVLAEKGLTTVVRGNNSFDIEESGKFSLIENDSVITYADSEATIFWPDRSITQLGENSKFHIHKMQVATDYSKIEIEASLLEGKVYSNIVRTLYPDSFLRIKLPSQNTIAGVRGTEFSINLENDYIHSVDHSVSLENRGFNIFGQNSIILFPGEIVSATNILQKLTNEVLDSVWENSADFRNNFYIEEHQKIIAESWEKISGNLTKNNYYDILVRKILSYFDAFKELEIAKKINNFNFEESVQIPKEFLLKFYQKFKMGDFATERDFMRGILYELSKTDETLQKFLNILASESLWDKLNLPTLDLSYSSQILNNYANQTNQVVEDILLNLGRKNYADEITNSIKKLFLD